MTNRELNIAKNVLRENHINGSPCAFWETEKYYDIAYMIYNGSTFIKRFLKYGNRWNRNFKLKGEKLWRSFVKEKLVNLKEKRLVAKVVNTMRKFFGIIIGNGDVLANFDNESRILSEYKIKSGFYLGGIVCLQSLQMKL